MKVTALVMLSLIIISCNDNIVIPENVNSYFPIQLGNSWTFDLNFYDYEYESYQATYTINKKTVINGVEWFSFDRWPEFIQVIWDFSVKDIFIRNDEEGNVLMRVKNREFMFLKFDNSLKGTEIDFVTLFWERRTAYGYISANITYKNQIDVTNLIMQTETQIYNNGLGISFYHAVDDGRGVSFFPGFGMVRMSSPSEGCIWKLKEAIINGNKKEKIISHP